MASHMSRTIRQRGPVRLNKNKLILRLFISSFLLFLVLGFGLGIHSAYAEENAEVRDQASIPIIDKVVQKNADYSLFPPKVITVVTNTSANKYLVFASTVHDVIIAAGVKLDDNDLTVPDLDEYVTSDTSIRVIDVDIVTMYKNQVIPFKTVKIEDENINSGTEVVSQKGSNGILLKTIRVSYHDGVAVKSEIVNQEVITKEVNQIIKVGTKPFTIKSCGYWGAVVDRITNNERERKWMKFVMFRESGCDSGRVSRGTGFYKGLFQFAPKTFRDKGGINIFDGTEQIQIVHEMYQWGDSYLNQQWPRSNRAFVDLYGTR